MLKPNIIDNTALEFTGLIQCLIRAKQLEVSVVATAKPIADKHQIPLLSYLIKTLIISSQPVVDCCLANFAIPYLQLKHYAIDLAVQQLISPELISRYRVIPLAIDQRSLEIGMSDPTDQKIIATLEFQTGLSIKPILVNEDDIEQIISTYFHQDALALQLTQTLAKISAVAIPNAVENNITETEDDEPVIEFVDHLLQDALSKQASDIHIEPYEHYCRIRMRQDGYLFEAAKLPTHLAIRVITRLKIIAGLNIAEKRQPQDGRVPYRQNRQIDIRMSTCPILFGEKVVLRLLTKQAEHFALDKLGLLEEQLAQFFHALQQPHGLIIVTGPTGSGKTMTLYSALNYLNQIEKNISTAEDPIEIELTGINQVNVNPKIGLDFPAILRAFLRQDPDIIMIGEIRDQETAQMAVQAAQTGHLVLSTLHTNSTIDAITRLRSMGIQPYHLSATLTLIIAQRLVRRLCSNCKKPEPVHPGQQGYCGRIGIFELLPISDAISQLINQEADKPRFVTEMQKENWLNLKKAGLHKVQEGITSLEELLTVIGG